MDADGADPPTGRVILHVDMDAFFVGVELLDAPELRGRPVVVGGAGPRGVVAAASYEARAYGVHSAMPSVQAQRLCPQAVFLPGRHDRYQEVSERVMAVFGAYSPLVQPLSLDEAFLDVTGSRRLHGDGVTIGHAIRRRVHDELGLRCSVGVASTMFVAKLASQAAKPVATPTGPVDGPGVFEVPPGEELAFLHPLPVRALWGVGPATHRRLEVLGITTVGDLAGTPVDALERSVGGAAGRHLAALARGRDDRRVEPDQRAKSIGHEETFARDLHGRVELTRQVVRMADAVAGRLRAHGVAARTVTLKVRFHDFQTVTRSHTPPDPLDTGPGLARVACNLLDALNPARGVRLLGVSASGLVRDPARQLTFDDLAPGTDAGEETWRDASRAVDRIRERFGQAAIGPASATGPDGLRLVRRGAQQWGPDDPGRPPDGAGGPRSG